MHSSGAENGSQMKEDQKKSGIEATNSCLMATRRVRPSVYFKILFQGIGRYAHENATRIEDKGYFFDLLPGLSRI